MDKIKILTKIMANRFKQFLPDLIELNQSVFVGGRCISNNIMLAQELVQGYNRRSNVPKQFICWARSCVTKSRFSISINGGLAG